ncbi:MAG: aspartate kinase [Gracilibacteraceae bacterium]|jgi:aspartate kinase|nr:aspartate kinase [Gracilibacteraceae bacterium]
MGIVVVKFGGTSVATAEGRKAAISHIASFKESGKQVIAVVSAMGRKGSPYATDTLISLLSKDSKPENLDLLMSCGEVISACVFADSLIQRGIDAIPLTSWQAGIITNGIFGSADIIDINTNRIKTELYENKVVVITGFQGISARNEMTTLGRGGSDTSAVVIGGLMKAEAVYIFTDVPGIAIIDPKIVPGAKFTEHIDNRHMHTLALWGARIVHPRAIAEAQKYNMDVYVRSTFHQELGTKIEKNSKNYDGPVGIALMKECNLFNPEEGDKLIAEGDGEKKAVRSVPGSKYSLLTVVFSGYSKEKIKNSMEDLPVKSKLFINELCAHIFIESRQAKSLANDLYSRLFGKVSADIQKISV